MADPTALPTLVTVECSQPGATYTLFHNGPSLIVHLAAPGRTGGTGPCVCGFDRFQKGPDGHSLIGFSVGGGTTGPGVRHEVCADCARLAGGTPIRGTHAVLFADCPPDRRDTDT